MHAIGREAGKLAAQLGLNWLNHIKPIYIDSIKTCRCQSRISRICQCLSVSKCVCQCFQRRFLQHRSHERLCRRRAALSDGAWPCFASTIFHPASNAKSCPIRFRPQWRRVVHVWRRGDICAEAGEMPADRLPCRWPKAISHLLCYADHLLIVYICLYIDCLYIYIHIHLYMILSYFFGDSIDLLFMTWYDVDVFSGAKWFESHEVPTEAENLERVRQQHPGIGRGLRIHPPSQCGKCGKCPSSESLSWWT